MDIQATVLSMIEQIEQLGRPTGVPSWQEPLTRMGLVSILMGLAVLLLMYGLWQFMRYRAIQRRLGNVVDAVDEFQDEEMLQSFGQRILRPMTRSMLTTLGRFTPKGNVEHMRRQLTMAGNPGNMAMIDFLGLKMLAAILTAAVASFYLIAAKNLPTVSALAFGVLVGMVGLYIPNYWLQRRIRQRSAEISKALPDALDMLTTMVEAGLGFDVALLRLREKWDNPLSDEFNRAVGEMRMGVRRADALRHIADRVDVAELKAFIAVLVQADKLGIPIARILQTQSEQIRLHRRQRAEEAANKMPVKMLPVIALFIFPALFAVILGPAVPGILEALGG